MRRKVSEKFPQIGMRIQKSAIAVFLCFLIYSFFRKDGILFYSQLAALWCIQPHRENMRSQATQRAVGTLTGAAVGLLVLLIDKRWTALAPDFAASISGKLGYALLVSAAIILVIYITLLIHKKNASYFSCVVFLSIVVNHIGDANPYLFVFNRVMDTLIGILIGMLVNSAGIPRRKEKDILFISGMDDTLFTRNEKLSDYSIVEINRMLADGAAFTISTRRTPASLLEPLREIHLKLPVIAMDGAVMYDLNTHEYRRVYVISRETARKVQKLLDGFEINYFTNLLMEQTLLIQYRELRNEAEKALYEKLHVSPYRNYTQQDLLEQAQCIYFMLLEKQELVRHIYEELQKTEFASELRMVTYNSPDYPGYAYIKIFNRNATRENMVEYLKKETGISQTITFGSIEGRYDVVIREYDRHKVAKTLKQMYEPPVWKKGRKLQSTGKGN